MTDQTAMTARPAHLLAPDELTPARLVSLVIGGLQDMTRRWQESGKAAETKRAYTTRVGQFTDWLAEQQQERTPSEMLEAYSAYLLESKSRRSAQAHLNTVKRGLERAAAYGYLGRWGAQIAANAALAEAPKVRGQIAGQRLDRKQRDKLLAAPGTESVKGLRDTAILALLAVCGLRRSEIVKLLWGDLQEVGGHYVVNIREGKAGRERTVKLPVWVWRALTRYAAVGDIWQADGSPVFVPITKGGRVKAGQGMTAQAVYKLICGGDRYGEDGQKIGHTPGYCELAGLPDIAPHDLRRTAAALAREGGAEIEQVQHMLGHASPQTTSQYIGAQYSLDDHAVDYSKATPPKGLRE